MSILHGECSSVKILCNSTDAIASNKSFFIMASTEDILKVFKDSNEEELVLDLQFIHIHLNYYITLALACAEAV